MNLALAMRPDARMRALEEEVKRLTAALEKEPLLKRIDRLEEENEALRQANQRLEWMLETPEPLPITTRPLSPQQLALYRVLEKHPVATMKALEATIEHSGWQRDYTNPSSLRECVSSQICYMRRKGVPIRRVPSVGYALIRDAP